MASYSGLSSQGRRSYVVFFFEFFKLVALGSDRLAPNVVVCMPLAWKGYDAGSVGSRRRKMEYNARGRYMLLTLPKLSLDTVYKSGKASLVRVVVYGNGDV
jgi:hypothetical protein